MENKLNRNNLIYETGNNKKDKTCDCQQYKTIKCFGREIYNNGLSLDDAHEQQIRIKDHIDFFNESTNPIPPPHPTPPKKKVKKEETQLKTELYFLMEGKMF